MIDKECGYTPSNNMRELIRDNAMLLPAISRFDISFGFGDSSIDKICLDNNVDTDTFISVCNLLSGYQYSHRHISLPTLINYLQRAHISFLDIMLPKIRHHLIEAINYSESNEVALLLIKFFDDYVVEVKRHMDYENHTIFNYVHRLLDHEIDQNFTIEEFSINHQSMTEKLKEIKDIFIYHYKQRDNDRLSAALFDIIICERDLMAHFQVENSLFVPAVKDLENRLRTKPHTNKTDGSDNTPDTENSQFCALSEREKDIIRNIAQGKSNKEIADQLCISVHTVATHRRNICSKLDIHSPAGLTIFAIINHLVDINEVKPI